MSIFDKNSATIDMVGNFTDSRPQRYTVQFKFDTANLPTLQMSDGWVSRFFHVSLLFSALANPGMKFGDGDVQIIYAFSKVGEISMHWLSIDVYDHQHKDWFALVTCSGESIDELRELTRYAQGIDRSLACAEARGEETVRTQQFDRELADLLKKGI